MCCLYVGNVKGGKDVDTKIQDALVAVGVFYSKVDTCLW